MGGGGIRIVDFDEKYSNDFARLNYEWIEHYFKIEPHDREMLDHPREYIIDRGGRIFFAVLEGMAVGTAALIRTDDVTFELAKMAVAPEHRGKGIGDLLIESCVKHAGECGAKMVFLLSNTRLGPAIGLYRKFGFIETPLQEGSPYARVNIRMELVIGETNR